MVAYSKFIAYTAMQPQTAKQKTKPHLSARQKEERSKAIQYNSTTNTLKTDSKDICGLGLHVHYI